MITKHKLALAALIAGAFAAQPTLAQTTLTFSSWVPPSHHLSVWQVNWAATVEKATSGRVKFQLLPKHPSSPPGTFDAVRDGLKDLSYVTASYTPVRHVMPLMPELPGAGLTNAEVPSALATASATPPPVRILRPSISLMPATVFLVNICPGPWVHTPSSLTPLYSPSLWKCFQWMRE